MPDSKPDGIIKIEGVRGESLFSRAVSWCVSRDVEQQIQAWIDAVWGHTESVMDERSLVLVGGLLVEDAIDKMLGAFIEKYRDLKDNRDFTLSLKIDLLRAMNLVPPRIPGDADFIRKLRNAFAHRIETKSLAELEDKDLLAIHNRLSFYGETHETDAEAFRWLVTLVCLALHVYSLHVRKLKDMMREDGFLNNTLKPYCEAHA